MAGIWPLMLNSDSTLHFNETAAADIHYQQEAYRREWEEMVIRVTGYIPIVMQVNN